MTEYFPDDGIGMPYVKTFSGDIRQRILVLTALLEENREALKLTPVELVLYRKAENKLLEALKYWRMIDRPIQIESKRANYAYSI